mgnify:CR=1 FL=1
MLELRNLPLGGEANGVADGGNGFPLTGGDRGEQGAGGGKDDPLPAALAHLCEKIAIEHRGGAAAAGGAGVHVLVLPVIEQQAAVLELGAQIHAVPLEKVTDDVVAQLAQVDSETSHANELLGKAVEYYDRYLELEDSDAARVDRALCFYYEGDTTTALNDLEEITQSSPDYAPAWANLGMLYEVRGDTDSAKSAYQKAAELDPDDEYNAKTFAEQRLDAIAQSEADAEAQESLGTGDITSTTGSIGDVEVTLVEMQPQLMTGVCLPNRNIALASLRREGVKSYINSKVLEVTEHEVKIQHKDGTEEWLKGFDYIVLGLGSRKYDPLSEELKAFVPEVHVIGDAIKPGQSSDAMHQGFHVGYEL